MKKGKATRTRAGRRPPPALLLAAVAVVAAAAAAVWFLAVRPGSPAARVAGMWAAADVDRPNVVLVTLDTTRADHLGCYGSQSVRTPVLDALAGRGVLFEQAASVSPLTLPAHASIMTGMYPTYHGVRVNGNTALGEEQTTLAEVFSGRGYACAAFIAAFVLDGRWGLKQGFGHYDDEFDLKKHKHLDLGAIQRPGNEVVDAALAWMDTHKDGPFFSWIHLYDPHTPYEPPEPYLSEYGGRGLAGLYAGEVAFMDEQIGRVVDWLSRTGLDRSTVVVLSGDHGEGLGSHGEGTHGYYIYDYAVHVPLIVVAPLEGLRGKRVAAQVSVVDIFPTLLDLTSAASVGQTHGRSLLGPMFRPASGKDVPAYAESMAPNIQYGWSPLQLLRTSRFKYIDAPRAELYDLPADPGELVNVLPGLSDVGRRMKTELDRLVDETGRGAPDPQAANLDRDTVERLAALGYVGTPVRARTTTASGGALADPKDKFHVFQKVTGAGEMVLEDKYAEAAELLEAALAEEPGIPQAMLVLSTCYEKMGRVEESKGLLDRVLRDDPENIQALISMANILLEERRNEDVIALCKRALSVDERNTQALLIIGEVYMGFPDYAAALPYFERAVEVQPKVDRSRFNLAACLIGLEQYERAEPILLEVLRESPKWPLANFNMGLLHEEKGRLEEARAAYGREVEAYPGQFKARFNLGRLLFRLGDRAGSLEQMREIVRITPKLAEGHLFLARGLLYEDVPLAEVRAAVDEGLALAETDELKAMGYFLLADIYKRTREPEKMNDALRRANAYRERKE